MAGGVPVLGLKHVPEAVRQFIDGRHNGIALRHRQGAAGTEVVLQVHDQKCIHGESPRCCLREKTKRVRRQKTSTEDTPRRRGLFAGARAGTIGLVPRVYGNQPLTIPHPP